MKPYPSYKPSGFAAVPSIPSHWRIRHFGRVGQLFIRKNRDHVNRDMLSLSAHRGIEVKQ